MEIEAILRLSVGMSACINIYPDEGNIGILNGKIGTVLEIECWDPGSSHQLLKEYCPQLSQGRRCLTCFGTKTRQVRRNILFVPSESYQRWTSSYTLTDEPWAQEHGRVDLDYFVVGLEKLW